MGILRISFHRGTLKSYKRFFPNLEFLYKTAGDPGGREEQGSLRRDFLHTFSEKKWRYIYVTTYLKNYA